MDSVYDKELLKNQFLNMLQSHMLTLWKNGVMDISGIYARQELKQFREPCSMLRKGRMKNLVPY